MANIPTKIFRGKAKDKNDYYFLSQAFPEKCKNGFIYGQLIIDERRNRYYICVSIIATMNCTIANGNCECLENFDSNNWLVIGNIHDNPEMLEVSGNE